MLVRFHTRAAGSVTLFGEAAVALLELMGMSGSVPGAVLAKDVPEALRRLKAGLAASAPQPQPKPNKDREDEKEEPAISLRTRAFPLVQLLEAAAAEKRDVVWEEEGKATG